MNWSPNQRRDTTRLIFDILCLAKSGTSKYGLISRANLRHSQAENLLSFLVENGHLECGVDSGGIARYILTAKGTILCDSLKTIQDELHGLFHKLPRLKDSPHVPAIYEFALNMARQKEPTSDKTQPTTL